MNPRESYFQQMKTAFSEHYREGSDEWSQDVTLLDCARFALNAYSAQLGSFAPKVLDLGCGNGRSARLISPQSHYLGIDLAAHSQWHLLESELVRFEERTVLELCADTTFDVIFDHGCFHHQHPEDWASYFDILKKHLSPSGIISMAVWNEPFQAGPVDAKGRFHFFFSEADLRELASRHHFGILSTRLVPARNGTLQLHALLGL